MDDTTRWDLIHQKTFKDREWHSAYAESKEKVFPRGSLVVDLGGGTGSDALYFLQKGHGVILLDISPYALKVSEEKAKAQNLSRKLVTRHMDLNLHKIPVKDSSVDVVYSRISLHYFDSKHTIKLFKDVYRVLKPGGYAYLTFKSPEDKEEMEYLQKSTVIYEPNVFIENGMLRSRFTKEQLESMLSKSGISNFQVNPYQENLGNRGEAGEGHYPILYLNEVVLTKPKNV